jgi:hypothetical protein
MRRRYRRAANPFRGRPARPDLVQTEDVTDWRGGIRGGGLALLAALALVALAPMLVYDAPFIDIGVVVVILTAATWTLLRLTRA